ncbi:hypothetical protein [Ruegeria arenilitoris]|uniref:hypothetical protein n=1 Tax=Ruegeria arenilitoris TaxID=1173585 RepID=UPI00147C5DCF|nr:hypothetical protein [Ruegeria arenilitoris]
MNWDWTEQPTLTQSEKAAQLGVQPQTLAYHRRRGTGPAFITYGTNARRYWPDHRTRAEQLEQCHD